MTRKLVSLLCLLAFLLTNCSPSARQAVITPVVDAGSTAVPENMDDPIQTAGTDQPEAPGVEAPWPTLAWQTSTPEAQGIDSAVLEKMLVRIKDRSLDLDSLVIIRNGYIVSETYFDGESAAKLHTQYSVTKSFTSTLLGIAIDQGKIPDVEPRVLDILSGSAFDNTDARKEAMTVENLLTMTSGLNWAEADSSYRSMYTSRDWVEWVMNLKMEAEPGKKFNYCSGCSHVLSAIIQQQVGMDVEAFGRQNLFEPLGITNLRWEKDAEGVAIGGWGLDLTSRDMAKLGYLFLHKGQWDGKQIVSSRWVEAATTKHVDNPGWLLDYGYQWWIARSHGAFAALGRGGQMIYVDPTYNLVVVFTAGNVSHDIELSIIEKYILPAINEAE